MRSYTGPELELGYALSESRAQAWLDGQRPNRNTGPWWNKAFIDGIYERWAEKILRSCQLGDKKCRQIEALIGRQLVGAYAIDYALDSIRGGRVVAFMADGDALLIDRPNGCRIIPFTVDSGRGIIRVDTVMSKEEFALAWMRLMLVNKLRIILDNLVMLEEAL